MIVARLLAYVRRPLVVDVAIDLCDSLLDTIMCMGHDRETCERNVKEMRGRRGEKG